MRKGNVGREGECWKEKENVEKRGMLEKEGQNWKEKGHVGKRKVMLEREGES